MELRLIGFVMAFKLKERRARLPLTLGRQSLPVFKYQEKKRRTGSIIRIASGFEVVPRQYPATTKTLAVRLHREAWWMPGRHTGR